MDRGNTGLELDEAVIDALPKGCEVLFVRTHGETNWSTGLRFDVEVEGEEKSYFLKVIDRPNALAMARGEFESQKALATYLPDNIAPVIAYGPLKSNPENAFFLSEFKSMCTQMLSPQSLGKILGKLHKTSSSPTGKFGFPVQTYKGHTPVNNEWCDKWEEWFTRQFLSEIAWEQKIRGEDLEFQELSNEFIEKVVPRLLRPLQTGERNIKPVLCHGDLWHGNVEVERDTQNPIMFDSCCVYGHNEYELSLMRSARYRLNADHVKEYKRIMNVSEPVEDFEDRLALYALRNDIVVAGLWNNWAHLRQTVKEEMRRLLVKYPDGYEGYEKAQVIKDLNKSSVHANADLPTASGFEEPHVELQTTEPDVVGAAESLAKAKLRESVLAAH